MSLTYLCYRTKWSELKTLFILLTVRHCTKLGREKIRTNMEYPTVISSKK